MDLARFVSWFTSFIVVFVFIPSFLSYFSTLYSLFSRLAILIFRLVLVYDYSSFFAFCLAL